jgi:hypothetical protein
MTDFEEAQADIARDLLQLRLLDRVLSLVTPPPWCVTVYVPAGNQVYFHYKPGNRDTYGARVWLTFTQSPAALRVIAHWYRPATKAWEQFAADLQQAAAQAQAEIGGELTP